MISTSTVLQHTGDWGGVVGIDGGGLRGFLEDLLRAKRNWADLRGTRIIDGAESANRPSHAYLLWGIALELRFLAMVIVQ